MCFLQIHKDNYGGSCKPKNSSSQSFRYWGVPPSPAKNVLILHPPLPPTKKITSTKFLFSPPPPPPYTKQQFSSYNPIKIAFLAVGIASTPLF